MGTSCCSNHKVHVLPFSRRLGVDLAISDCSRRVRRKIKMSEPAQGFSVIYINSTGSVDFHVVVYEANSKVAWRYLFAQTKAEFVYPASTEVGAYYFQDDVKITMGPFPAQPGSTWEIEQVLDSTFSAAVLKEGASYSSCISLMYYNYFPV